MTSLRRTPLGLWIGAIVATIVAARYWDQIMGRR